jgi:hypothetical protein
MSLPIAQEVRKRIEEQPDLDKKKLFQTVELFGLRIGEACGYRYQSEVKSQPTGMLLWATQETWQPRIEDDEEIILLKRLMMRNFNKELTDMEVLGITEQAFVLSIITEKREGYNRKAAIPLNPMYEPWAKEVFDYIAQRQVKGPLPHLQKLVLEMGEENGKPASILSTLRTKEGQRIIDTYEPVFPFRRQEILPIAVEMFKGFSYPITKYNKKIGVDDKGKGIYETVPEHQKRFGDHAIRHSTATKLKSVYRIHGEALDKFMGWSKPRGGESSAMQDRYVLEPWREAGYFPRLLRKVI